MEVPERKSQPHSGSQTQSRDLNRVRSLIERGKLEQALRQLKQIKSSQPDKIRQIAELEGEILLRQGRHALEAKRFRQAQTQFQQAAQLEVADAHYWLARTDLAQDQPHKALESIKQAFDSEQLPKPEAGCYLKLLFLVGDTAQVQDLLEQQTKRFTADQKHWAQGVLALMAQDPTTALLHLKKVKGSVTPGDDPAVWTIHALQQAEHWQEAQEQLNHHSIQHVDSFLGRVRRSTVSSSDLSTPLRRLLVVQNLHTDTPIPEEIIQVKTDPPDYQQAVRVLQMSHQYRAGNRHDAGHTLLEALSIQASLSEDLASLRRPLLLRAGQQAQEQREPECAEIFWLPLSKTEPLDPQLARHLVDVLEDTRSFQERRKLLTRWINSLEREAQRHPQNWPPQRLNVILATLHCWLADTWIALGQRRTAYGSLQRAERLQANAPEVLGRRGLRAYQQDDLQEAQQLMTEALEKGCRFPEVYALLMNCLEELGDHQGKQEIRRRFGKHFGDLGGSPDEVDLPPWIEALAMPTFADFCEYVEEEKSTDTGLQACRLFIQSVVDTKSERPELALDQARVQWQQLLDSLSPEDRCLALQAIVACIQKFAKRKKGLADLSKSYVQQVQELIPDLPEAEMAYLAVLALRGPQSQLQKHLLSYLRQVAQPDTVLARLQLQTQKLGYSNTLRSYIDQALSREPQNSLLLLAQATTFKPHSQPYEELAQQGFELARRLQHSETLQAYREQEHLLELQKPRDSFAHVLPLPIPGNTQDILRALLEKVLEEEFGDLFDDDEEEEAPSTQSDPFRFKPKRRSQSNKRSRQNKKSPRRKS